MTTTRYPDVGDTSNEAIADFCKEVARKRDDDISDFENLNNVFLRKKELGYANYVDSTYTSGSPLALAANTDTVLPNDMAGANILQFKPEDIDTMYCQGYLDFDNKTGNFTKGDTITGGTSGAAAVILSVIDTGTSGRLLLSTISGTFQDNEEITDTTSGVADVDGTLGDGYITGQQGDAYIVTFDFKVKPTNGATTYIEDWIDIGGSVGELYRRISTFPKGTNAERSIVRTTAVYTLDTWEANGGTVYVRSDNTCDIYDIRFTIFRLFKAPPS